MKLTKMTIIGSKNSKYSQTIGELRVQVNPSEIKFKRSVNYRNDATKGTGEKEAKYVAHGPDELNFDLVLDDTGTILSNKKMITENITYIEKILYTIQSGSHEPSYVKITWGNFLFKGRLTSLNYDYTMFRPDGSALRVKISLGFRGHADLSETVKQAGLESPDLSRIITLKASESIAAWCKEIYDDPSYCVDIARYNGLNSFRNVKPGTRLMFPPLMRNG